LFVWPPGYVFSSFPFSLFFSIFFHVFLSYFHVVQPNEIILPYITHLASQLHATKLYVRWIWPWIRNMMGLINS
jgi:hypothetical protein